MGGTLRYLFGFAWRLLTRRKNYRYSEYLYGPEDTDDFFAGLDHQLVNKIIGLIALFVLLMLIMSYA